MRLHSLNQIHLDPRRNHKINTCNIAKLSKNLFDKIDNAKTECTSNHCIEPYSSISEKMNSEFDSLTKLLAKAHNVTHQSKKRISGLQGTFLTGTGHYEDEPEEKARVEENEVPSQQDILKNLIEKEEKDDLAELRRMIRETDENIADCHRKVTKTHKNIMNYVDEQKDGWKERKSRSTKFGKNRFR